MRTELQISTILILVAAIPHESTQLNIDGCDPPCQHGVCNVTVPVCNCQNGWSLPDCAQTDQPWKYWNISHLLLGFVEYLNFLVSIWMLWKVINPSWLNRRFMLWISTTASFFAILHHICHYFTDHANGMFTLGYALGSWFEGAYYVCTSALHLTIYLYWLALTTEIVEDFISYSKPFAIIFVCMQAATEIVIQILQTVISARLTMSSSVIDLQNYLEATTSICYTIALIIISVVLLRKLNRIKNILSLPSRGSDNGAQKLLFGARLNNWSLDRPGCNNGDSSVLVGRDFVLVRKERSNSQQILRDMRTLKNLHIGWMYALTYVILEIIFFGALTTNLVMIITATEQNIAAQVWARYITQTGRRTIRCAVISLSLMVIYKSRTP